MSDEIEEVEILELSQEAIYREMSFSGLSHEVGAKLINLFTKIDEIELIPFIELGIQYRNEEDGSGVTAVPIDLVNGIIEGCNIISQYLKENAADLVLMMKIMREMETRISG